MYLRLVCWLVWGGAIGVATHTSANEVAAHSIQAFSQVNVFNWLFALVVVIGLFLVCAWVFRKLNFSAGASQVGRMRVVGGITLGFREKVILLQVGSKQLVLAITPGRIEMLTTLEGNECLPDSCQSAYALKNADFAQKLMQAIKGQANG